MKKALLSLSILIHLSILAWTQETSSSFSYQKEFYVSAKIHTHGYLTLSLYKSFIKNAKLTEVYGIEVGTLKHIKESSNNNRFVAIASSSQSNPYIFGKKNSLYLLRANYGQKRFFSEKKVDRGITLGISYRAGVSLGFLKPYYLDLRIGKGRGNAVVQTPYTEEYAGTFTNVFSIAGASGFRYGWDDLSLTYGGHAQAGLLLDWGAASEVVRSIEIGFMLDVFYQKVPIMITEKNQPAFFNVYLSFHLGKRS